MNNYNEIAEKNLLEMAKKEEMQNKKLMMYENVIGFGSTISFLTLIFVTSFLIENNIARILLFILAFVLLIIGVSFALKIETETGYYECQNAIINMCQNTVKYILQCTLELQDIWNVQNVMRKVGKEKF